ncbi:MAG: hypothetical protein Ta2F_14670 [Termitinemataceae bacterium]|nr:MAG: hypothetical protein Ta2F_14670 [Termitinemataceae bacterium]
MKKTMIIILGFAIANFSFAQSQLPENGGFRQEGVASWYGTEFSGRPTASGEIFDPNQYTAAHRDLPYGTILTVTNMNNGKQVQVRVNDRGPFHPSRIIDVSQVAAGQLDMLTTGTAQVTIEIAARGASGAPSYAGQAPLASAYQQQQQPQTQGMPSYQPPQAQQQQVQPQQVQQPQTTAYQQPVQTRQSMPVQNQQQQMQQQQPQQMQQMQQQPPQMQQQQQMQPRTSGTPAPYPAPVQNQNQNQYQNQNQNYAQQPAQPNYANQAAQTGRLPAPAQPNVAAPSQQAAAQQRQNTAPAQQAVQQQRQNAAPVQQQRQPQQQQPQQVQQRQTAPTQALQQQQIQQLQRQPTAQQTNQNRQPVPQSSAPRIPAQQPVTVTNNQGRNSVTPAYSAQQPAVTPQQPPQPVPMANPNAIQQQYQQAPQQTRQVPQQTQPIQQRQPTAQLQPVPTAPRPPTAAPVNNYPNVNDYQQAQAIPPAQAQPYRPPVSYDMAEIKGATIQNGKLYRLQIGSYKVPKNAIEAIERLGSVGITAQYEPYGEMYRVVISNVRPESMQTIARQLGSAGFREAIAREER